MPKTVGVSTHFAVMGAGTAQSRVLGGDIDFAALELSLSEEQLANGSLHQFPVAFGALVCVVNIPGISANQLRLDGVLLAGIYGGTIKKWNDPKIRAANAGLALPDLDIRPLRLDLPDGSVFSTTTAFTQYLLATNPDWRAKFGDSVGKRRWAVGSMTGSAVALAETMKVLPGSIGYMALGTALSGKFATVMLKNRSGEAVGADMASLNAAVAAVDWARVPNMVASMIDLPGQGVWPLVLTTYFLIPEATKDRARSDGTRAFVDFAIGAGAGAAGQSNAVPVPAIVRNRIATLLGIAAG